MIVLDDVGQELKVGDRVTTWWPDSPSNPSECEGIITKITEPDADYDDNLERGVFYPPKVYVRFDDGDEEYFSTSYTDTSSPDREIEEFQCEDVTKL